MDEIHEVRASDSNFPEDTDSRKKRKYCSPILKELGQLEQVTGGTFGGTTDPLGTSE